MSIQETVTARCLAIRTFAEVLHKDQSPYILTQLSTLLGELKGIKWWYEVIIQIPPPECIYEAMQHIDIIIEHL